MKLVDMDVIFHVAFEGLILDFNNLSYDRITVHGSSCGFHGTSAQSFQWTLKHPRK